MSDFDNPFKPIGAMEFKPRKVDLRKIEVDYESVFIPKERPILFSTDMVQAILVGRKSQTRRVINPQPILMKDGYHFNWKKHHYLTPEELVELCPYGQPGDVLYVREKFFENWNDQSSEDERVTCEGDPMPRYAFYAGCPEAWVSDDGEECFLCDYKFRPSIHMPKDAARIWKQIKRVWVEQVQDISEEDCIDEGVHNEMDIQWKTKDDTNRGLFGELWDSINEKRGFGWDQNPWVWVVEFEVLSTTGRPTDEQLEASGLQLEAQTP